MFCPRCGTNQSEDLKFCKSCGANLHAVRLAVESRETPEKFDWSKTWVAEMFVTEAEKKRRREEIERQRGITPEVKRYQEIKAGVITSSIGLAVTIVLIVLMQGIINGSGVSAGTAEILSRIWVAGLIPSLVGLALIINGVIVSKRMVEVLKSQEHAQKMLDQDPNVPSLRAPDTPEFMPGRTSVTEGTTRHLGDSEAG